MEVFLKRWALNILVALDRLCNALFFFGAGDETISSHAGKEMLKGTPWACRLCKWLDWFQKDHCLLSINQEDGKGATLPD